MKSKYIKLVSVLVIILTITTFLIEFKDMSSKTIDYHPDEIKKIAYDYLSNEEKSKLSTSIEDYLETVRQH